MARMRPPRVPETPRPVASETQISKLLKVTSGRDLESVRDHAIIRVFLGTGMRRGEMVNLRREDVDVVSRVGHARQGCSARVWPHWRSDGKGTRPVSAQPQSAGPFGHAAMDRKDGHPRRERGGALAASPRPTGRTRSARCPSARVPPCAGLSGLTDSEWAAVDVDNPQHRRPVAAA